MSMCVCVCLKKIKERGEGIRHDARHVNWNPKAMMTNYTFFLRVVETQDRFTRRTISSD